MTDDEQAKPPGWVHRLGGKIVDAVVSHAVAGFITFALLVAGGSAYRFRAWLSETTEEIPNWLLAALVLVAAISVCDWIWRLRRWSRARQRPAAAPA